MLPIVSFFIKGLLQGLASTDSSNDKVEVIILEPDYSQINFENIKKTAMAQAACGDHRAREWLTKNVFNKSDQVGNTVTLTDPSIIKDGIDALVAMKMKKAEAKQLIHGLASRKKYKSVSDLLMDAFKK